MSLQLRLQMEQLIVTVLLVELFKLGYRVIVDNGEEESPALGKPENVTPEEFAARVWKDHCAQTDEDRIFVVDGNKRIGWVYVVYGNDGWDAISDYTTKLEELLKPVQAVSDALEAGKFKIVPL